MLKQQQQQPQRQPNECYLLLGKHLALFKQIDQKIRSKQMRWQKKWEKNHV